MSESRPNPWLTRNVVLLSFCSLFADISTEMIYPVMPLFLAEVLGAGGSIVGLVGGVALATQNIVKGASGSLSDRLQRRNLSLLAATSLSATPSPWRAWRHYGPSCRALASSIASAPARDRRPAVHSSRLRRRRSMVAMLLAWRASATISVPFPAAPYLLAMGLFGLGYSSDALLKMASTGLESFPRPVW